VGTVLLIRWQSIHPMLDEQTMHRVAGDRELMKPLEIVSDLARAEVILLPQVQNLADHVGRRGARRPMGSTRTIT
jgi:hypothetical protein